MAKIQAPLGGYYQSYAPGDGGISFVHSDLNGEATNEQIPDWAMEQLKPEGFKLRRFTGGIVRAYDPVKRIAETLLLMENQNRYYLYAVDYVGNGWKRYVFFDANTKQEVINENMKAAMSFFLNNEREFTDA